MSDLKVLSLPDTALAAVTNPMEQAQPLLFRTLTPATPLLLSCEVYHLTYGPDDRTDYRSPTQSRARRARGGRASSAARTRAKPERR